MARIVQKFGGTSVADVDRIRAVARRVVAQAKKGDEVVCVVSAMAGATNQLVGLATQFGPVDRTPEYDTILSSGEQVTAGLTALALRELGFKARSWLGWEVAIRTDDSYGRARIRDIDVEGLDACLKTGEIQVVAGFQGLSPEGRPTTLGRGGSDTTAVALAAALKADRCDIYTDVDGIYTADPRIVAKARKLDRITYEEIFELASLGAKVLHTRSVELAMKHRVRLRVLSSFNDSPGTLVVDEDEIMEHELVTGIAYSRDEAKVTLTQVADRPGVAARILGPLAKASINVDMIVQNVSADGKATDLTFTVALGDAQRAVDTLSALKSELGYQTLSHDLGVAKVSVIGVGMRTHAGIAHRMFQALADKGINIQVISTSEIKISVLIAEEHTEQALRALHATYGLDAD
jgi:aspartate kinase